ncbi:hypothetical protein [Pseudomonas sp. Q1]|uniref:hypothetical protein n=1 Tax=Pseudomonas sp. Q1 TaxID=2202823 RepID=UPI001374D024|nr:hypothetical protein [Pseudomonas sp. Q1]NCE85298.1 hypothetical protein [Pseudomonas sp. Q1]
MISIIRPLPSGNALRVFLEPPVGSLNWRVLRKVSDTFTGPDDASALRAYEGSESNFVDVASLANEVMVFYRPYYWNGSAWLSAATVNATPRATYVDQSHDAVGFLRDRLEAGLLVEVQRGNFSPELGYIAVYTTPPTLSAELKFPFVTLQLEGANPVNRAGEESGMGVLYGDEDEESEGWLEKDSIRVLAWSLNSDERPALRNALRRLLLTNLPVFDARGFQQVSFGFSDIDVANGVSGRPMYQTLCNFTCLSTARVSSTVGLIGDIEVRVKD